MLNAQRRSARDHQQEERVKTYTFKVVVEPDEDRWFAYCPALEEKGRGYTKEEALKNIQEVIQMVVAALIEDGEPIPLEPPDAVQVSDEPAISVIA
jgi:predicted RNase H-like HicB family nuclease